MHLQTWRFESMARGFGSQAVFEYFARRISCVRDLDPYAFPWTSSSLYTKGFRWFMVFLAYLHISRWGIQIFNLEIWILYFFLHFCLTFIQRELNPLCWGFRSFDLCLFWHPLALSFLALPFLVFTFSLRDSDPLSWKFESFIGADLLF